MNKTIAIMVNETKEKIIQVCNSSELPPCILELILQNVWHNVNSMNEKQLQEDMLVYANDVVQNNSKIDE